MTDLHHLFFVLLRAGLWNQPPDASFSPLTADQWEQIYQLARQQTVEGIVFDGVLLLPATCLPPHPLLLKWTALLDGIERNNRLMNRLIVMLNRIFTIHDITAWLLKGQGVAACYVHPLHRVCGDIDWYFPHWNDFRRANQLMTDMGAKLKREAGFSVSYVWQGIQVEHHSRIFDLHNPFHIPFLRRLQASEACKSSVLYFDEQAVMLPSPLLSQVQVNAHILKHMLSYGIGLRQLCDSARLYHTNTSFIDKEHLREIYHRVGILSWVIRLHTFLVTELGLPAEDLPFPLFTGIKTDRMKQDILRSGNFGFYRTSSGSRGKGADAFRRNNTFSSVLGRFVRHVRYVPGEACWFPFVQMYSHLLKYTVL